MKPGEWSGALTSAIRAPIGKKRVKLNGVPNTDALKPSGIEVVSVGVYLFALIWISWPYAEPGNELSPARLK